MHIVNIKKSSIVLAASLAIALLAVLSSVIFVTNRVYAVDAIKNGCVAQGGSTGFTSPYKSTPKMCLGDGGSGIRYYQFAITLNKPISGVKVESTAKNLPSGSTLTFTQENSTTWVSQPSSNGLGYQASVGIGTTIACNDTDPANLVKVNVTGPGSNNTQEIQINLCSFTGSAQSNSVISKPADNIKDASGAPTATKGTIKANLGVQRNDPLVPDKLKKSGIKKDYITSIKLSSQATKEGDNTSNWYSVDTNSDGFSILTIANLDPGTYNLDITYNDKPAIDAQGGAAEWTISDVTFSFPNIYVSPGDNWVQSTSDTNVYYANSGDPNQTPTVQTTNTCVIEGVGWIVCPVVNFLAKIADGAFNFLSSTLLKTDPGIFNQSGGLYQAWVAIRNIANVAFVIAFLIIIFSQLTGIGVTNYGVKKLLPRIIVAAILVNVSFYICAIAVDISNILGFSLDSLFSSIGKSSLVGNSVTSNTGWFNGQGFGNLAGGVLAFAAGGVLLYALLSTIVPALLAAVVALLMILLILVMRQALIVLLVAIAPLAFVAYLLPNTEKWFTQWRKMFTSLLLVFPIVAVIFGASSLASSVLLSSTGTYDLNASSTTTDPNQTAPTADQQSSANKMFTQLMAALVLVLPLFLVPVVLKKSLDGINGIGATVNKLGGRLQGASNRKAKSVYDNSRLGQFRKYRSGQGAKNRALAQSGAYAGRNPLRKLQSSVNGGINDKGWLGQFGAKSAAAGVALAEKTNEEEVQAQMSLDKRTKSGRDASQFMTAADHVDRLRGGKATSAQRLASIRAIGEIGGMSEVNSLAGMSSELFKSAEFAAERQEIAAVAAKKMSTNNPAFGGKSIAAMGDGSFNSSRAYLDYAAGPNFTAQSLLGMDSGSREEFLSEIAKTTPGSKQREALERIHKQITDPASTLGGSASSQTLQQIESAINAGKPVPTGATSAVSSEPTLTVPHPEAPQVNQQPTEISPEWQEWHRQEAERQARQAAAPGVTGSHVDEQGRQTPDTATGDYHDRMQGQ